MAEAVAVVGMAAAAVQFLDVGGRAFIAFSSLCSNLKRVPKRIRAEFQQIEQVLDLVRMIEADIKAPNVGSGITLAGLLSQTHSDAATRLLDNAISRAVDLEITLKSLLPAPQESARRKAWRSVISVQREEEILERCRSLEEVKSTIQLWQNHANLVLTEDVILTGKGLEGGVRTVNHKIDTMTGELFTIKSNATNAHASIQREVLAIQEPLSRIETKIETLGYSLQSPRTDPGQIRQEDCARIANQIVRQLVARPTLIKDLDAAAGPVPMEQILHQPPKRKRPIQPPLFCSCRPMRSGASVSMAWQTTTVYYHRRSQHRPDCPWHRLAGRSWTFGLRTTISAIVARSVTVTLNMDFGAGGFSLAPVLSAVPVVDRTRSPAFAAVDAACEQILQVNGVESIIELSHHRMTNNEANAVAQIYQTLYNNLQQVLSSGRASARDQTQNGATLLHALVRLSTSVPDHSGHFINAVRKIITLLGQCGLDFKAVAHRVYGKRGGYNLELANVCGNALSVTLSIALWYYGPEIASKSTSALARTLSAYGCDSVTPIDESMGKSLLVEACIEDPELVNDLMLSEMCLAVAKRSEPYLRQLISTGRGINEGSLAHDPDALELTPLCFAFGWPTGFQVLLEAGADPSAVKVSDVRRYADASTAGLLLDYGYPLFRKTAGATGLQCLPSNAHVLNAIATRLAQDRQQLAALARNHLSSEEQEALELDASEHPSGLLDRHAKSVADALEKNGIDIPAKIWPGYQKTVFHLDSISREVAKLLFASGFCDIDVEDDAGYTPFALACWRGDCYLVDWYLDKGANPRSTGKAGFVNVLHLVAHSFYRPGCRYKNSLLWKGIVQRFLSKPNETCRPWTPDDCSCYCSVAGCLPAGIFTKKRHNLSSKARWRKVLAFFTKLITPDCSEAAYLDACRVEVFERLGMAHTCCKLVTVNPGEDSTVPYAVPRLYRVSEEEQLQLREEDVELKDALEAYMHLNQSLRSEFSGRFALFWDAWWEAVGVCLPQRPRRRYRSAYYVGKTKSQEDPASAISLGYEPNEEAIRAKMRDLLPLGFRVDPGEIFSDCISNLFDDGARL